MMILEKLWKFANSEHFNELYEEIVRKEDFVSKITTRPAKQILPSPFDMFNNNGITADCNINSTRHDLSRLVTEVKLLIEALESSADPNSCVTDMAIFSKIQSVKSSLQYMN